MKLKKFKRIISERVFELNKISLDYPIFEIDEFFESNRTVLNPEELKRYEIYCILWFNLCNEIFEFVKDPYETDGRSWYDTFDDIYDDIVDDILYIDEIFKKHYAWFNSDITNKKAYGSLFYDFVNYVINHKNC